MIKDVLLTFKKPKRKRWGSPVPIKNTILKDSLEEKCPKRKPKKKKEDPQPPPETPKKKRKKGRKRTYYQHTTNYLYESIKYGNIRFYDSHDPCEVDEKYDTVLLLRKSNCDNRN